MCIASHSIGQSLAIWQNCHICLRILYSQVHSVVTHLMHSMCWGFVTVYRLYWNSSLKATRVQVRVKEYGKKYNHPAMTSKTKKIGSLCAETSEHMVKGKFSSKCQLSLPTPTHFSLYSIKRTVPRNCPQQKQKWVCILLCVSKHLQHFFPLMLGLGTP